MNWLRKIGNWLWLNKERMVLGIMVCILVFRVYQVVYPAREIADTSIFQLPRKILPEDDDRLPRMPPVVPSDPATEDWSRLWRSTPFQWRQPRQSGAAGQNAEQVDEIDLTLLQIREGSGGTWLAQIRTASRTTWYSEGDAFEQFNLEKIDSDAGCVTIFSEQLQKMLGKCIEEEK